MFFQCGKKDPLVSIFPEQHIVLIGNNLGSRMMEFGHFETELQLAFPDHQLFVRNMCDGGNTAGFRPHSSRKSPWAFPGAEEFYDELAEPSGSTGHLETPDEWLTRLGADVIIGFFGYSESFKGADGVKNFEAELKAFIDHTRSRSYNGESPPQLILVSPAAFEDLSETHPLPDGTIENLNLLMYTNTMRRVCKKLEVPFVDAFRNTRKWYNRDQALTIDGSQFTELGYRKISRFLVDRIFGEKAGRRNGKRESVRKAVLDKNWFWHNDYKIPNGVHVHGRRYDPFGPDNYPYELEKIRQLTANRDTAIWRLLEGKEYDLEAADDKTRELPEVETNYVDKDYGRGTERYLYGDEALSKIYAAPGYKVEMFASEEEFPDLANPVQLSFDNKGRLWVAVMPSYPHYKPGDAKPDDKLIILEDTDGDGKADRQIRWADGLHLPIGFEIAPEGVYVSQGTHLKLFSDTDGDDKADKVEILLSGFDDHDTHHAISAFTADPSGAIYMAEGVFLHTNVETSYGPVRATNGGFYRFDPLRRQLERTSQIPIPNPWGIAFDDWAQPFFLETSGPALRWMMPGTLQPRYGVSHYKSPQLIEKEHLVRPTSGLEFVSSRHFPDEVQGDILLNNTIGFLGAKQHSVSDDGTGYKLRFRQDLFWSDDRNFRPVDLEFAPDGSLYFVDWHNVLIGHMQHNARDPLRDHVHGRVYRVTYPGRPLLEPAKIAGASIGELLDNLKLPEYRTRYRTRRELRGRDVNEVMSSLAGWIDNLDPEDPNYEQYLMEALWVTWGLNKLDTDLLEKLMNADDYRVRAAVVRVIRYTGHLLENQVELLKISANDPHSRVRLEAIVAASWLSKEEGLSVLAEAVKYPLDQWMSGPYLTSQAHLNGEKYEYSEEIEIENPFSGEDAEAFELGRSVYMRDGHCGTCHQSDGKGLPAAGFPPLAGSEWVTGEPDRLIRLTLKGLMGPITVNGVDYPGQVPMTPFEGLLDDEEIAGVLTYVRNAFGNEAGIIQAADVARIRAEISDKEGFYSPEELTK